MSRYASKDRVSQERYDHTRGLDWPAMRGVRFSAGYVDAWVSDLGHVEVCQMRQTSDRG